MYGGLGYSGAGRDRVLQCYPDPWTMHYTDGSTVNTVYSSISIMIQ